MFNFANAYAKGLRSDTFQVQTTAPYCILNDPYSMDHTAWANYTAFPSKTNYRSESTAQKSFSIN